MIQAKKIKFGIPNNLEYSFCPFCNIICYSECDYFQGKNTTKRYILCSHPNNFKLKQQNNIYIGFDEAAPINEETWKELLKKIEQKKLKDFDSRDCFNTDHDKYNFRICNHNGNIKSNGDGAPRSCAVEFCPHFKNLKEENNEHK